MSGGGGTPPPACAFCGQPISLHRLKHNSKQRYCSRKCASIARAQQNPDFLKRLSKIGNAAQATIEQETGVRPGRKKRLDRIRDQKGRFI